MDATASGIGYAAALKRPPNAVAPEPFTKRSYLDPPTDTNYSRHGKHDGRTNADHQGTPPACGHRTRGSARKSYTRQRVRADS